MRPAPQPARATPAQPPIATIAKASRRGRMTGFEPRILRDVAPAISVHAHGTAGLGLFDSGFDSQRVYAGQMGEMSLYKALCKTGIIDRCSSYWSVAMPAHNAPARPDPAFSTDVDCVIVQGADLFLLDLKYYASGDVTWHCADGVSLLCRDNSTGSQVGSPRKMSRNMAMATERFTRLFPHHRVRALVVLIPTDAGLGQIAPGTQWPGAVPLIGLPELIATIGSPPGAYADPKTGSVLRSLVKD